MLTIEIRQYTCSRITASVQYNARVPLLKLNERLSIEKY